MPYIPLSSEVPGLLFSVQAAVPNTGSPQELTPGTAPNPSCPHQAAATAAAVTLRANLDTVTQTSPNHFVPVCIPARS